MKVDPKRMYSIKEVAAILDVAPITIRRAINVTGELVAIKVGGVWRIEGDWLLEMVRRAKIRAAALQRVHAAKAKLKGVTRQSPEPRRPGRGRRSMRRRPARGGQR